MADKRVQQSESILVTHADALGGEVLNPSVDMSHFHQICQQGQTIVGTPTVGVLKDNVVSTDLVVSNIGVDTTRTKVIFTVTNVSAVPPSTYRLSIAFTLSGGEQLREGLDVSVEFPKGSMETGCQSCC